MSPTIAMVMLGAVGVGAMLVAGRDRADRQQAAKKAAPVWAGYGLRLEASGSRWLRFRVIDLVTYADASGPKLERACAQVLGGPVTLRDIRGFVVAERVD